MKQRRLWTQKARRWEWMGKQGRTESILILGETLSPLRWYKFCCERCQARILWFYSKMQRAQISHRVYLFIVKKYKMFPTRRPMLRKSLNSSLKKADEVQNSHQIYQQPWTAIGARYIITPQQLWRGFIYRILLNHGA